MNDSDLHPDSTTPQDLPKNGSPFVAVGDVLPKASWTQALDQAIVNSTELRSLDLPKRAPLLGAWFCEGDLGLIYARRGVGKTWFSLMLAVALSEGSSMGPWKAHAPVKVLYIDGEMPPDLMRDREQGLRRAAGEIEFLSHEILFHRAGKVLNISDLDVQQAITAKCIRDKIKVVILDNLSTLASGMNENDSFEWEKVSNWLLQFRRLRIAVIMVHHAGRNGEARGTSKREDAAFWVTALDDAKAHADDKNGACFISRFAKPSRNTSKDIPPYEWQFMPNLPLGDEITVTWKLAGTFDVFLKLIADGVTRCAELAEELGVSRATISRMAKKAMDADLLEKTNGSEYKLKKSAENDP